MPERGDSFTLYLRGGEGSALRDVLKPFGNGGDLERWTLDAWDAEVVLGRGAQVALIRVPATVDTPSARTLIIELHQAAAEAGLVLSDDISSRRSPTDLIKAFGLEGDRADAHRAGKPDARWGLNKSVAYWIVGGLLLMGAVWVFEWVSHAAHHLLNGG